MQIKDRYANCNQEIQQSVNITTVYVTHDQEAMSVSDRIAVMKDGYIQHGYTAKYISTSC